MRYSAPRHLNKSLGNPSQTGAKRPHEPGSRAQGTGPWRCQPRRRQGGPGRAGAPRRLPARRRRFRANMAALWLLLRALRQGQGPGPEPLRGPCLGWGPALYVRAGRRWPYFVHRTPIGITGAGGRALQVTPVAADAAPAGAGRRQRIPTTRLGCFPPVFLVLIFFCLSSLRFEIENKSFTIFLQRSILYLARID